MIRRTTHRASLSLGAAALVVAAAACANTAESDFSSSEEPTAITLTAREGDVVVRANSASGTEVRWDESNATPTATLEDGILIVSDDCETGCSVDYTLLVGDAADVTIRLGSGNVSVSDVDGLITVDVDEGNVSLNTIAGGFDIDVARDGDILGARLEGASGSFVTAAGSIDVTFDTAVTDLVVRSGDGDVTAQLPGGPYAVDASASGSIDILVDEDAAAAATVIISTDRGTATVYKK